jgi:hypothetical protein
MGRIGRSFQLVGLSYRILMQDKELMVLPLVAGVIIAAFVGVVMFGAGLDSARIERFGADTYVPLFGMYVAAYAIGIFFQAAVVAGAVERMRGGDPTIGSALAAAGRRAVPILLWAVLAATVGVAIQAIHERLGFIGRIITSIVGAAWSLATFFVVPVLVFEDKTVRHSVSRSVSMFRETWGETVVGGTTLGAAAVCAWLTLVAATGLLAWMVGTIALAFFAVGAILLMIFFTAMQGVYVASLYRYATAGRGPAGFDEALLRHAFVPKRR